MTNCNFFIEIALRHGCSPANLLHIFRTPLLKKTSERLLLLFFLIYINDLSDDLVSNRKLFADDTSILCCRK